MDEACPPLLCKPPEDESFTTIGLLLARRKEKGVGLGGRRALLMAAYDDGDAAYEEDVDDEGGEGGDRSMDRMRNLMLAYYGMSSEQEAEKPVADLDIDAAGFNADAYMKVGSGECRELRVLLRGEGWGTEGFLS